MTKASFKALINVFAMVSLYAQMSSLKDDKLRLAALQELSFKLELLVAKDSAAFLGLTSRLYSFYLQYVGKVTPDVSAFSEGELDPVIRHPSILKNILRLTFDDKNVLQYDFVRLVLSLLASRRVARVPVSPDYTTITHANAECQKKALELDVRTALDRLGLTTDRFRARLVNHQRSHEYSLELASGPNGHALFTAHLDAKALSDQLDPKVPDKVTLLSELKKFAALQKLDYIVEAISELASYPIPKTALEDPLEIRRLVALEDKAGKTRIVAILDYFSQQLLTPIHLTLQDTLRDLPMDYHLDQTAGFEAVMAMTKEAKPLSSIDLKAATDYIPVVLQEQILAILSGSEELARLWKSVLVSTDFGCSDGQRRKYGIGQPMGAKSSFTMFSLAHHVLVQIAAKNAGYQTVYTGYAIIGDDIVIDDKKVKDAYIKLTGSIGLEISSTKSVYSTGSPSLAEFCRRVAIDGREISPLPCSLLAQSLSDAELLPTLQNEMQRRGFLDEKFDFMRFTAGFTSELG